MHVVTARCQQQTQKKQLCSPAAAFVSPQLSGSEKHLYYAEVIPLLVKSGMAKRVSVNDLHSVVYSFNLVFERRFSFRHSQNRVPPLFCFFPATYFPAVAKPQAAY